MKFTEFLNLKKPEESDAMDVGVLGENFDAIDGQLKAKPYFGVCSSVHGSTAKVVECSGFKLQDGARIAVMFANGNSAQYMTLNVNNTGAYFAWFPVGTSRAYNNALIAKFIAGGGVYEFVYQDGSTPKWMYCGATDIPIDETTPTYTEASNRENVSSGEKLSVAFGKIKKWFSDLKSVAFSGSYSDLSNTPTSLKNPNALSLSVNGSASNYDGSAAVSKSFYAPTSVGTAGYGLISNGSGAPVWKAPSYAVCSTAGATAAKTVSITNFKLLTGARVLIKFTHSHTSILNAATLNVNNTGAKPIIYFGNEVRGRSDTITVNRSYSVYSYVNTWDDGEIVEFVYDGENWVSAVNKKAFNPDCIVIGTPVTTLYVGSSGSGSHLYTVDPQFHFNVKNCDFLVPADDSNPDISDTLQEAIDVCKAGGRIILPADYKNLYIKKPIELRENRDVTIEGCSTYTNGTTLNFSDDGKITRASNYYSSYILRLKNLRIASSTLNTILDMGKDDSYDLIVILENVKIEFSGDNFGEFYPVIVDKVVMKNCTYTVKCTSASGYYCWSGIDCNVLEVEDSIITLTNNYNSTFDLNFIYNSEVTGYIRNSKLIGSGSYRTNFTNGQLKIDDCEITLGENASLCHYTTDTERKNSILRDCVISYYNSMYLTFGKVTGCTFKNTKNTNWATDAGKLQILCPTQMTNNTFEGRSEMNFNENKVLFADNVLQYEQSYTTFPAGSVNANTMISN